MAEKLTEYEFGLPRESRPWEKWMDGSIWSLTKDDDFPNSTSVSMSQMLYARAKRAGKKCRCRVSVDAVVFQFYDPKASN